MSFILSPIDITSRGYLKLLDNDYPDKLIAIASRGYIIIVVVKLAGGSKKKYRYGDPLLEQALREDAEILEIIIAITASNIL